ACSANQMGYLRAKVNCAVINISRAEIFAPDRARPSPANLFKTFLSTVTLYLLRMEKVHQVSRWCWSFSGVLGDRCN
ncbi:hypothetical protein CHARACLAT_003543, partial [Characodon lateralis]|nr:hypothetical protein [Characodon lateralis]